MRLFTAIELPAEIQAHMERAVTTLRQRKELADAVAWARPTNVHITLKFLGELDESQLPALQRGLATLTVPTMTFKLDRFLVFPGTGPARVLACNVAGDTKALIDLFTRLEPTVKPLGIRRDAREYKPHVTLGRFRRQSLKLTAMSLIRVVDPTLLPTPEFTTRHFALFKSTLDPAGAIYEKLADFGPT